MYFKSPEVFKRSLQFIISFCEKVGMNRELKDGWSVGWVDEWTGMDE